MRHPMRRGFTLYEALIVLTVIVILLLILVPSVSRARHQSRLAQCAANLHQFAAVLVQCANDARAGAFPTGTAWGFIPEYGQFARPQNNLWDVPTTMLTSLTDHYKFPRRLMICPSVNFDEAATTFVANSVQSTLGYAYWVPRIGTGDQNSSAVFPPPPDRSSPYYDYAPDPAINPQQGPRTLTSPNATTVPILSDAIFADYNGDAGDPSYPARIPTLANGLDKFSSHLWNGAADAMNRAYADGRVERARIGELHATYNLRFYCQNGWSYPGWNWQ